MSKYPIIVTTSDKYLHLIPVFCYLFNHNWSAEQEVMIVGYDEPKVPLHSNFTFHSLGKQVGGPENFSTDLRKFFETQPEWVIWMMDDTFIRNIDFDVLRYCEFLAGFPKCGKVNLTRATRIQKHQPWTRIFSGEPPSYKILEQDQVSDYRLATQPSIWNRDYLLKYLTPGLTPWKFEVQPAHNDGWRIFGLENEPLIHNEGTTKHDIYKLDLNGIPVHQIQEMEGLGILTDKMDYGQTTRDKILVKYLKVCREAAKNDAVFAHFKSIPDYQVVLEHCSYNLGLKHWANIRHDYFSAEAMAKFMENDKYGSPQCYWFEKLSASPTTIQYISVLSNLITLFGSLQGMDICIIGDGYGGQAKIIKDMFKCNIDIIDLYEVTLLQERYLKALNSFEGVRLFTNENYALIGKDNGFQVKEYSLFISNYALSEVSAEDQLKYVKDLCLPSKRGYITCNQPLNGLELLKEKYEVEISPDIEGERKTNYLLTWK